MKLILQEIANLVDGSIVGNNAKEISGLNSLENADLNQISHAVSGKYKDALINSKAGAIIINEELKEHCNSCLLYTSPSPRDQRGSRMPSSA